MGGRVPAGNRLFSNINFDTRRSRYESSGVGAEEERGWRRERAATTVHGVVVVGGGMVAAGAATGAAAKVTAAAVRCGSVQGATEVAVVNGARAEFCCRSGAGGAMKTAGGDEVRSGCVDDDQGSSLILATRAACLRLMFAISSTMVCRWAVTSWKRVLNSRAWPSCISAVRRAAAAEESWTSCWRRAAVSEEERTSAR